MTQLCSNAVARLSYPKESWVLQQNWVIIIP